jgi:hypothetical protein
MPAPAPIAAGARISLHRRVNVTLRACLAISRTKFLTSA